MRIERRRRDNRRLSGIGASGGIALGLAHVVAGGGMDVPERRLAARAVAAEQTRFDAAVEAAREELTALAARAERLPGAARGEMTFLLDAHLQMLTGSRLVRGVYRRIGDKRVNAEAAVKAELSAIADAFAAMEDAYLAQRAQDVRDVARRLIRHLTEAPADAFAGLAAGTILIAEELSPADIALLDPKRIGGFATELGGPQGHTAIMARSLGLPAVVGVPGLSKRVLEGDTVIVDGASGTLTVAPDPETVAAAKRRRTTLRRERRTLAKLRDLPAVTRDGVAVSLRANLELPGELGAALESGAEGIGLLRTEFLYMNRSDPPDAEVQFAVLRDMVEGMGGSPVVARTLDIGTDKIAYALEENVAAQVGANPALGLRAIRLSLSDRELLETQLEAMLRAGRHGDLKILLPMITAPQEVRQTRAAMRRVARRLKRAGVAIAEPLPALGAMIETPAAALSADRLCSECDFLSLGTNDLTMYTLAVDRGDEHVASLYDPLHPAVLRLIQFSADAASRAACPLTLCGEIAGEPRLTPLLVGLGLTDLSMVPGALPAVKKRIRAIDATAARELAGRVMRETEPQRIADHIDRFNDRL
jgi:phosphoenolpyruvate-protein phosphotransferase (PTS system enzyme I)